jgi:hypothetical protein
MSTASKVTVYFTLASVISERDQTYGGQFTLHSTTLYSVELE